MCCAFIKNVLGVGSKHHGLFGKTSGYYGTVEQQGRLTLHLHLLVWIKNSLSPQEICSRIIDRTSNFQQQMVQYLESVCKGEFFDGNLDNISQKVAEAKKNDVNYTDPTKTMPEPLPPQCKNKEHENCENCLSITSWWLKFTRTVDDLLLRSNVHKCRMSTKDKDGNDVRKGCLNKKGCCKAQFLREVVNHTMVDPLTGALRIKKEEAWLNTFTPAITYLFRCNTDMTSLLSGTAVKAIVAYISDYVTKPGLSTYSMFDTIRHIFDRSSESIVAGNSNRKNTAKSLITQMVNALTSKMEFGSPMACLYLLCNPDHYTGFKFVNFYWKNFVHEVQSSWNSATDKPTKVVLNNNMGKIVGLSNMQDYMHRPKLYNNLNLYDWIRRVQKKKRSKVQQAEFDEKEQDKFDDDMINSDYADDELDLLQNNSLLHRGGGKLIDESDDELNVLDNEDADELYEDIGQEYEFLSSHPQYQTHYAHQVDDESIVPNFIRGTLPRCDQGDREYYCLTMLTLFKPWRFGTDLKI
jgi:hypothetical protein